MKSQNAILEELQGIQRVTADIKSMSIIDRRGVIIASTMMNNDEISATFGETVYTFFIMAKELAMELHKGVIHQLMIREQEGITFVTEINSTLVLLTTTPPHVKYALMAMDLKRIAIDLGYLIEE